MQLSKSTIRFNNIKKKIQGAAEKALRYTQITSYPRKKRVSERVLRRAMNIIRSETLCKILSETRFLRGYEDLFISLRLNIRQTGSILASQSRLESCKQGQPETVQNFSVIFKLLVNELR